MQFADNRDSITDSVNVQAAISIVVGGELSRGEMSYPIWEGERSSGGSSPGGELSGGEVVQGGNVLHPSFNVSFLENPTEYPHKPYIARN